MVDEVCSLVEDVGSADAIAGRASMPGHSPISIILSKEEDRPAGTTWVFADGSQVLSSSAKAASVDDVLDEIDQFGMQTGGEHYNREQLQQGDQVNEPLESQKTQRSSHHYSQQQEEEGDDLNAFMDEFELNTQGENFRHPSEH
jgi:hypothetical protein